MCITACNVSTKLDTILGCNDVSLILQRHEFQQLSLIGLMNVLIRPT